VASPRVADRPAGGWPTEVRIIMTPSLPPNYCPSSSPLIMEFTLRVPQILVDPSDPSDPPKPLELCMEFKSTTNVRAIKGLVIKNILHHLKIKVDAKKKSVTLKGAALNLRQNLASIGWEEGDVIEASYE
jgi:hypothetical protein